MSRMILRNRRKCYGIGVTSRTSLAERRDQVLERVVDLVDRPVEAVRDLLDRLLQRRPAAPPPGVALLGQPDEVRAAVGRIAGSARRRRPRRSAGSGRTPSSAARPCARPARSESAARTRRSRSGSVEVGVARPRARGCGRAARPSNSLAIQMLSSSGRGRGAASLTPRGEAARRARRAARPKTSTALVSVTTLSPAWSILSRSRVSGMSPGSRSVTSALIFMRPIGTCTLGRRMPAHALEPLPELVPAHGVGAAELERPVLGRLQLDRLGEVRADVVGPDRLDALRAAADDRRDGREPSRASRTSAGCRRPSRR